MNFFHHKGLGYHLLQLCSKVVKHPVYGQTCVARWAPLVSRHSASYCATFCRSRLAIQRVSVWTAVVTQAHIPVRRLQMIQCCVTLCVRLSVHQLAHSFHKAHRFIHHQRRTGFWCNLVLIIAGSNCRPVTVTSVLIAMQGRTASVSTAFRAVRCPACPPRQVGGGSFHWRMAPRVWSWLRSIRCRGCWQTVQLHTCCHRRLFTFYLSLKISKLTFVCVHLESFPYYRK